MPAIAYSYRNVPTLAAFSRSNAFIRGIMGPFGSGKSSACAVEIPYRGQMQAPGRDGIRRTKWAVIRNTYGQLRDTTIKTFHQWLPPEYFGRYYVQDTRYVIRGIPGCEMEVLFRALDKPEHVRNLLSLDLTGGWINEAREVPWAIMEALQGRIGRFPQMLDGGPTWFGLWADTNPPDSDSRWYKFFEEGEWRESFDVLRRSDPMFANMVPEDFAAIFKQPSGLSPLAENLRNLRAGYYPLLQVGKSREWKKVYVDGEYGFVTDDKAVFPEFVDALHVKAIEPIPGRTIYRGWDFGLTPCCGFSQLMPDGRWLIFDEMISESMGIDRFSDQVLTHCARTFRGPVDFDDYGDPAGQQRAQTDERTCFDIMQAKGIQIRPGLQSEQLRLESFRRALTKPIIAGETYGPTLVVHPRCKVTRKALMGGYHYRRMSTNTERYTDGPEKNHPYSDIMDANEYVATILFGPGLTDGSVHDDYPRPPNPYGDQGRSEVTGY